MTIYDNNSISHIIAESESEEEVVEERAHRPARRRIARTLVSERVRATIQQHRQARIRRPIIMSSVSSSSLVLGQEFSLALYIYMKTLTTLNCVYPDLVHKLLTSWPTVRYQFLSE